MKKETNIVNKRQAATILGCSAPTIVKKIDDGLPYVQKGCKAPMREWLFDKDEIIAWTDEQEQAKKEKKKLETKEVLNPLDKAKLRKLILEGDRIENRINKEQAQTIEFTDIWAVLEPYLTNVRKQLTAMITKSSEDLTDITTPQEVREIQLKHLNTVLEELPVTIEELQNAVIERATDNIT